MKRELAEWQKREMIAGYTAAVYGIKRHQNPHDPATEEGAFKYWDIG